MGLAAHEKALTSDLQESLKAFYEVHNVSPESISIDMQLNDKNDNNGMSTIKIVVKDTRTDTVLINV